MKSIIVQDPIFKPDRLPVFEYIQGLIQSPEFMAKGSTPTPVLISINENNRRHAGSILLPCLRTQL